MHLQPACHKIIRGEEERWKNNRAGRKEMMFTILNLIQDDLQGIFENFYEKMLSDKDFAVFFRDDTQIRNLVDRQQKFFVASLTKKPEELKTSYVQLGEMHYDLKLPYVDFSAAMTILEEGILVVITRKGSNEDVIDAAFRFFRLVRGFTAKGYLNRMLESDAKDIDLYLENINRSGEVDTVFVTERIVWLKDLISAIKSEDRSAAPSFSVAPPILDTVRGVVENDPLLMRYIEDTLSRIEIDAANVFYFLEHKSYEEVLTLYRELMNIYKLSLMLTNVITIATTSSMIGLLSKDSLTGLLTRHSLESIVAREVAIADASGYELALIMADVDHFKMVNDTYGHAAGDAVLVRVARILQDGIRSTDYAFRYGGEEFLLILKGAPQKVCIAQAEAIKKEVEETRIIFEGVEIPVTISLGVATFLSPMAQTFKDMLREADKNLYRAKESGRNRVCF